MAKPMSRVTPKQNRAIQTRESILAVSKALIIEVGALNFQMAEVSQRTGLSIGSIYKYFSNKEAIFQELAKDHLSRLRKILFEELLRHRDVREPSISIPKSVDGIIDRFFEFYQSDRSFREIWSISQVSIELIKLDKKDSKENAKLVSRALSDLPKGKESLPVEEIAFFLCDTTGYVLRSALDYPQKKATQIKDDWKFLLKHYLLSKFPPETNP
ncbi:transcriptional regulator, TetR family [Leptospira ryugenii]|uniref:Transcriptional regulator, TetR family n=2 Tax=Leptospira ryugenii TaxID=1917863 RepID=A0A2P2E098_9LEPT|nr:transcriptional regulator, TetR family [Leptospira ryugenii]